MTQPCRNGETSGGAERHGIRRRGAVAIGLVLFLIGACASTGQGSDVAARAALDRPGAMFAGAYRQIRDYYLDPISVETVAVAGIDTLDPDRLVATLDEREHTVRLLSQGEEVARLNEPDANDAEAWAKITSAAMAAARAADPALTDASDEQLYQRAFDGITAKLDRFTRYAGAEAARDQKAARDGFGGVGLTLDFTQPQPRITMVLGNGPSAKLGIKVDDRLLSIDGVPTAGLDQSRIIGKLRGRPESRVVLTLRHVVHDEIYSVTAQRMLIVPPSVTVGIDDGIAILHVSGFNADTAKSLGQHIARLRGELGKRLTGIVLDLRGNPGGLLDQAVDVAGLFLNRGQVVATKGRHPTSMQDFEANGSDQTHGLPLVVLVNGGSASSAEIVAAALQDHGRAVIIGSSSYGKGTVQMVWPLENTGELTLTWARLVTPSGTILHNHGVVPAFCTSRRADGAATGEDAPTRIAHIIAQGLHPTQPIEGMPRASLTDAGWERLRGDCPAEMRDSDLDVKLAKQVLHDPGLYAQALTLPGIAVARVPPDGHAMRSALQ